MIDCSHVDPVECAQSGHMDRHPMIEVPGDSVAKFDFHIDDEDGDLWGLTQDLKRINDQLTPYNLGVAVVDRTTGRHVVLAHFVMLIDDRSGTLEQSGEVSPSPVYKEKPDGPVQEPREP